VQPDDVTSWCLLIWLTAVSSIFSVEGPIIEKYLFLMQFDLRVEVATMYKKEGFVHNRKQEQLVATAVVASQQIPDADVTLPSVSDQPAYVTSQSNRNTRYVVKPSQTGGSCNCPPGMLHYPCKHVMKVVSLSTGKSGPEIILALGTWAGTEMGGFKQLENDLPADSLEQLEEDFSLAAATGTEEDDTAAANDGRDTAGRSTAAAVRKPSNTSDDALDALYSNLKASTQHAPELRQHLCSQLRQAQGCIETIKACNSTGVAHPAGRAEEQFSQAEELHRGRPSARQEGKGRTIGCQH